MEEDKPIFENRIELSELAEALEKIKSELGKIVFGQDKVLELLFIGLLCDGHILMEGVPGVGKTLSSKLLAKALDISFQRIQFTPDLMPSDILGTSIFNSKTLEFEYKPGPIFKNYILIDEINRSPAKTQAALFELMEEKQVTIDGCTYPMKEPFIVVATQNPVEQEGTYRLPEAQLDRFLFKIIVNYPHADAELGMLRKFNSNGLVELLPEISKIISGDEIVSLRATVKSVRIDDNLLQFIGSIVQNSRSHRHLDLGASPRAAIALMNAAKGFAAIRGRDFVTPDDIKSVGLAVLGHRVILRPEAEIEALTAHEIIEDLFKSIEVPR
ncbi:MoxR family ATPase [uncultured Arcticibacterium sp.]|uniref:AAA family ATPase n=1 Tax=uncultured Arcticibacterium sp. TaxID=2173042 RepID=UPI0030FB22E1